MRTVLITGAAGFIGFHLAKRCLEAGDRVIGLDNFNDYYAVSLKESRADQLKPFENFEMHRIDLSDAPAINALFRSNRVRDERAIDALREMGYRPAVIWECAIRGAGKLSLEACARITSDWIKSDRKFLDLRGTMH